MEKEVNTKKVAVEAAPAPQQLRRYRTECSFSSQCYVYMEPAPANSLRFSVFSLVFRANDGRKGCKVGWRLNT